MINIDISNVWGPISLPELLATEKEVFGAHQTLAEGNGDGSLAYAARTRVNEHGLPWLHAPADNQRVVGCAVDNGHRGGLLEGPKGAVQGSALA